MQTRAPRERAASRARSRAKLTLLGLALVVGPSCTSDHSGLAARPHPAGAGGQSATGGLGGAGGRAGAITKPNTGGTPAVDPGEHVDTPGRSVYTVVHGIVDADLVVWCFARVRDGETKLVGEPVPKGGIEYGETLSFEKLPSVKLEKDGVVPYVITGDLALIDGLDCAAAVARAESEMHTAPPIPAAGGAAGQAGAAGEAGEAGDGSAKTSASPAEGGAAGAGGAGGEAGAPGSSAVPPALRVGALPGMPPGSLAAGFSMLEVATGCFGAPAFTHRLEQFACGADYTPLTGSLSADIALLARDVMPGMLALQAFHASRGTSRLGIRSTSTAAEGSLVLTLVDNFTEGTLRPREPRMDLTADAWGANTLGWSLETTIDGVPYTSEKWLKVRSVAGISQLELGRGYTVIAIGPSISLEEEGWWHAPAFALVDNEPDVSEF